LVAGAYDGFIHSIKTAASISVCTVTLPIQTKVRWIINSGEEEEEKRQDARGRGEVANRGGVSRGMARYLQSPKRSSH